MNILKTSILTLLLVAIPCLNANAADIKESLHKAEAKAESIMSDTMITAKVKELFLENKNLPSLKIHVQTHGRVVTLTGSVYTRSDRDLAIALAKSVRDVASVNCKLEIG